MTTYLKTADRRQQLLSLACNLAVKTHYRQVRRNFLADLAETATGNVSRVFGTMDDLRTAIVDHAISEGIQEIIAQAIIDKHPSVKQLTNDERVQALASIL